MLTRLMALALGLLLLVAACNDGDGADEAADAPPADEPGVEAGEEAPDADLDEGTAASVNGTEIPASEVDRRIDAAIEADDELAGQFEGEEGEQLLTMFRAQTLTVLVQTHIILGGAADLGVEPTDEEVADARTELVAQLGGEEQFDEAVAAAGMSDAALREQLEGIAALNAVGERLVEEGAADELPDQPEGAPEASPEDLAVQQWLGEQVAQAEVAVSPEFGQWDPQTGQVVPAGGPVMPGPPVEGDEGLDESGG